jgi:hypothetical protein
MNHVVIQYPFAAWAAIYAIHIRAKNFPPTVALNPRTSLKLLIDVLMLTAMVVDVIAAICSNCVLMVVIAAPAVWILPYEGMTNAAADRIIDKPFPIRLMMNTVRTMADAASISDFADFPMPGTLLKAGTVMLVAATSVESETLLVRFAISDSMTVRFKILRDTGWLDKTYKNLHCRSLCNV